jgi:diadenosine tetraphosphate (Ap4A) HIT family hydrolase
MDSCIFCEGFDSDRIIYEDSTWIAVLDAFPVSNGHTLLIPKRHCETYFDLDYTESSTLAATINVIKLILDSKYNPNGYNIGVNCGKSAGQTVPHCHIHIIPRYDGDVEDPRGGVRGCIPHLMKY